ncbi:MAG: protein adenylyltransferase SelO family protein, partial [Pseudomonadota bacterium]
MFEFGFKGSGATPFSRGGDGKAALGPMLREVLISEAMHALGIATTRSLAVVKNNQVLFRDPPQPRAILTRIASSHIRVGTFQFFAARSLNSSVQQLCDFCLARHYPHIEHDKDEKNASQRNKNSALALLEAVVERQAALIAHWMSVGFIHGVMNTDNMLISGETIDYGPCAFMDTYNPNAIYSSIDARGRYRYINQPSVAQWNLSRFAETLLPLIHKDRDRAIVLATEAVQAFSGFYDQAFRERMRGKLGIDKKVAQQDLDALVSDWLNLLNQNSLDFTRTHRLLGDALDDHQFFLERLPQHQQQGIEQWLQRWTAQLPPTITQSALNDVNPAMIPRNHLVEDALTKAWQDNDYVVFNTLLASLRKPFETPDNPDFIQPAPMGFDEQHVTYCGT